MATREPTALLQDGWEWKRYVDLDTRLECSSGAELQQLLGDAARAAEGGLHAVGYISYEAAGGLGLPVLAADPDGPPLACFGLYRRCEVAEPPRPGRGAAAPSFDWAPSIGRSEYVRAVSRIREHLAAGDTYQVNLTFPLTTSFDGDPWELFSRLVAVMRPRHGAYLDLGRHVVASASPELLFSLDDTELTARPMKGTLSRAPTLERDATRREELRCSEKNRAENVMIVDMVRNDLGRVAEVGSVRATSLFDVETYPTLHQLTSTVTARSRAPLSSILAALFPCASVTGAPKRRTMELISALERSPRGVYTGAIGHLSPGRRAAFNVAIRTIVVDREKRRARYGVGSGIVADSDPADEYAECLLKARVLEEPPFCLLETLRWTPEDGYWLLDEHLARVGGSGSYFSAGDDLVARAREALAAAAASLDRPSRVRLLADLDGRIEVQQSRLESEGGPLRVGFAVSPVSAASPWLFHKTTRREQYERALRERPDCDDVLLWNERMELTESTRANVLVELPEGLCTPPVDCGLLPGTYRRRLLEEGRVRERRIAIEEIPRRRVFLVNSVQGCREAHVVGPLPSTGAP